MKNSLSINGFEEKFRNLISENNLSDAINLICNVAHQITISGKFKGVALRLPELDAGLIIVANLLKPLFNPPASIKSEHVCLVTEFHNAGGHKSILNSVCEEIPSHVIFTDLFDKIGTGKIKLDTITPKVISSIVLNPDSFLGKVHSAVNILNNLSPKHLWIFSHHQDVIALLAALIFDDGRRSIFVHHCDHDPALGATIKFPLHFDFTDELHANCHSIGLEPLPLALYTRPASHRAFLDRSKLIVLTAGSLNKFIGEKGGICYKDVVKKILQHPSVSCYHHIGEFPEHYALDLQDTLVSSGIDSGRIKFAGRVTCVSDYALSVGAQIYFSSFPVGGGASTAEIQSAGIPVIFFDSNHSEMPLCSISSIYGSVDLEWSNLDQINLLLDKIAGDWSAYSDASFEKYMKISSREIFLLQIEGLR